MGSLPDFVPPMLAKLGSPFDSDEHLFEIKWDGIRALTFVEGGAHRMLTRNRNEIAARYPELEVLARLPEGTVLDGELVALQDGRPDFRAVMSREHARNPRRIQALARDVPVTYVVFDLLYDGHRSVMEEDLVARRERARALAEACADPRVVFSDGVVGGGRHYFEEVAGHGFEGVVAKRLGTRYESGRRTGAWTKIKRVHSVQCAIVGFEPDGEDLKSLVVATLVEGELRCVGRVGSGLTRVMRERLNALLRARLRPEPIVACPPGSLWVEPELYCLVEYLEHTPDGNLRAPVFVDLVADV